MFHLKNKTKVQGFFPKDYRKEPDFTQFLENETSSSADLEVDVLVVGGGPAGLSSAIAVKEECKKVAPHLEVALVEKASSIGGHSLSGAIVDPCSLMELFPHLELKDFPFEDKVSGEKFYFLTKKHKIPLLPPPPMKNKNLYTLSLCRLVRWMEKEAGKRGIHVFSKLSAHKLLVQGDQVKGITTVPHDLNRQGELKPNTQGQPKMTIKSRVLVLAEGSRGHLTETWRRWQKIGSYYPQTYGLGVKEIWHFSSGEKPPFLSRGQVLHTMGWPLSSREFGGSWLYPMGKGYYSLGFVGGLDSPSRHFNVHHLLQALKTHPLFFEWLKSGTCVEWGAKTLPEGGYYAMPEQLHGGGVVLAGDCAGMVNVASLKGIHYAITGGLKVAQVVKKAIERGDFSKSTLSSYDRLVKDSRIGKDLYRYRNLRQSFKQNVFFGMARAGAIFVTGGRFPGDWDPKKLEDDQSQKRTNAAQAVLDKSPLTISKSRGVYLSGNSTRDDIPSHLQAHPAFLSAGKGTQAANNKEMSVRHPDRKYESSSLKPVKAFYDQFCPAGVFENTEQGFSIKAPNCIDCKATDVLGPGWTPREGGSGPRYKKM